MEPYHEETASNPHILPTHRALWNFQGLRMEGIELEDITGMVKHKW